MSVKIIKEEKRYIACFAQNFQGMKEAMGGEERYKNAKERDEKRGGGNLNKSFGVERRKEKSQESLPG